MKKLNELVKMNNEKQIELKELIKNYLLKWELVTEGCQTIVSDTLAYTKDNCNFVLAAGSKEIKMDCGLFDVDVDENKHFLECISYSDMRIFVENLPDMVQEIRDKIEALNKKNEQACLKIKNMIETLE